jgi:hypothetical protein
VDSQIVVRAVARDPARLAEAGHLRHAAYLDGGHIDPLPGGSLLDAFDEDAAHEVLAADIGGRMQGTIRLLRRRRGEPVERLLSQRVFAAELSAALGGASAVECNRLAIAPGLGVAASLRVKLGLLRVAATVCASEDFECCVACVRDEHLRFYVDFMGLAPASAPRVYPGLKCPMTLLVGRVAGGARAATALQSLRLKGDALRAWENDRAVAL